MWFQILGDDHWVFAVLLHAQRQRLQTAIHLVAIERRWNDARWILQESQLFKQFVAVGRNGTHNHIRMAVHVFGHRIRDDISSQLERALEIWCQKCVIDNNNDVRMGMRNLGDAFDVDNFHAWIRWCLDPNHLRTKKWKRNELHFANWIAKVLRHLLSYYFWLHFSNYPNWLRPRNRFGCLDAMPPSRRNDWFRRRHRRTIQCGRRCSIIARWWCQRPNRMRMSMRIWHCPVMPGNVRAHLVSDSRCDHIRIAAKIAK